MKRARVGIIAIAALAVATVAFAQKPDFSGTWTLDPAASPAPAGGGGGGGGRGGGGMMGGPMTVKHAGDTLTVERMQGENKVVMTYKLDGSQSKNTVQGRGGAMEQVSVAKWDGSKIVITRTQQMGDQSVEVSETWAMEAGNLTIERTGGRGGATKQVYKKG